jgi:hypothetical protein
MTKGRALFKSRDTDVILFEIAARCTFSLRRSAAGPMRFTSFQRVGRGVRRQGRARRAGS